MLAPPSALFFAACLLLLPAQEERKAPSPEDVKRACVELEDALRGKDEKALARALQAAQDVDHAEVVKRVTKALADERASVRLAALQALRFLDVPEALSELHRLAKDKKRLREPDLGAALLRAIGEHADPGSVTLLAREPFDPPRGDCVKARIYSLARIRTRESLEGLLAMVATTAQGNYPRPITPYLDDARLALVILTGTDQGKDPARWEDWWRANRKDHVLPERMPELPRELAEQWAEYWGLGRPSGRGERREDRGNEQRTRR